MRLEIKCDIKESVRKKKIEFHKTASNMFKLMVCLLAASQIWAGTIFPTRNNQKGNRPGPKIIGGSDAEDGAYPYAASIRINDYDGNYCGAFLVSEQHLVTAAGCVFDFQPEEMSIYLGSVDLDEGGSYHNVTWILVHPGFSPLQHYDDIAVVKLDSPVELGDEIQTIALAPLDFEAKPGEEVTAIGWGDTLESTPSRLQYLTQQIVDHGDCEDAFGTEIPVSQICFGGNPGFGNCFGDSGNPLVYTTDNATMAIGIMSYGKPCAVGTPDVYTGLALYREWIRQNLK